MEFTQWFSPAIVIAIVVLLWRQTNSRLDRLGDQVNGRIDQVSNRIDQVSSRLDRLADTVAGVDRRLASLAGRITGWQDHQHGPAA